jgi:hypothetical protein
MSGRLIALPGKSLFKIFIPRLFGLFSAIICQRCLRIFFECAAFAFDEKMSAKILQKRDIEQALTFVVIIV